MEWTPVASSTASTRVEQHERYFDCVQEDGQALNTAGSRVDTNTDFCWKDMTLT